MILWEIKKVFREEVIFVFCEGWRGICLLERGVNDCLGFWGF